MIGVAADLAALIRARHQLDVVVEYARQQRLLFAKRVEVSRLERGADVAGAHILAVDPFLGNQGFEPDDRRGGDVEELPRA